MTYYTEGFSGNTTKAFVFDDLSWCLYPRHSVCFPFTEPGLFYEHWTFFFLAHTQNGKLADCEEIFSGFDKNCIGLES